MSGLSPLMRVPGASVNQEQKCSLDGKRERSAPISAAMTNAVSTPMQGIAVRSTPEHTVQSTLQDALARGSCRRFERLSRRVALRQLVEGGSDLLLAGTDLAV